MVFEALAPGEWTATTNDGEMKFNLTEDAEVTLNIRKYDCLVLSIESKGKISALGLRNGDKLVRIDGADVHRLETGLKTMVESFRRESTTWTVIREGGEVDVTFNGKELDRIWRESDGEELMPVSGFRD